MGAEAPQTAPTVNTNRGVRDAGSGRGCMTSFRSPPSGALTAVREQARAPRAASLVVSVGDNCPLTSRPSGVHGPQGGSGLF